MVYFFIHYYYNIIVKGVYEMIKNVLNKCSVLIIYTGLCMTDSHNLLIPIMTIILGGCLFKLTFEDD